MTSPPERPWAGTSWETVQVAGPPRWRRGAARPLVVLFALVVLAPFVVVVWMTIQGLHAREELSIELDNFGLLALQPGQCVNQVGNEDTQALRAVPCSGYHDGEVTAVVTLTPGRYPGKDAVIEESSFQCATATNTWIADGPGAEMDLQVGFFYPSRAGWAEDHPTVLCYAVERSGTKIRGPLGAVR